MREGMEPVQSEGFVITADARHTFNCAEMSHAGVVSCRPSPRSHTGALSAGLDSHLILPGHRQVTWPARLWGVYLRPVTDPSLLGGSVRGVEVSCADTSQHLMLARENWCSGSVK